MSAAARNPGARSAEPSHAEPGVERRIARLISTSESAAQYPSANFASSDIISGDHGGSKTIFE
jgi:hypothetical protein